MGPFNECMTVQTAVKKSQFIFILRIKISVMSVSFKKILLFLTYINSKLRFDNMTYVALMLK